MRRVVPLVLLAGACSFTLDRELGPGDIRGVLVFDAVTSGAKPAAGARVVLEGSTLAAKADANGRFVLRGLPAGEYTLRITASRTGGADDSGLRVGHLRLDAGEGLELGTLALGAFGALGGSVDDAGHAPPDGTQVVVGGIGSLVASGGAFTSGDLVPGDYDLVALAPGTGGARLSPHVAVHVAPRGTASAKLALAPEPAQTGSIAGRAKVVGAATNKGITVLVEGTELAFDTSSDAGDYVGTEIPAGVYTLRARRAGFADAELPYVVVGGETTPVPMMLLAAGASPDGGEPDGGEPGDGGSTQGDGGSGEPDGGSGEPDGGAGGTDGGTHHGGTGAWSTLYERPAPRRGGMMVYDASRKLTWLFGGGYDTLKDLWTLDLSTGTPKWTWIDTAGDTAGITDVPQGAVIDTDKDRLVVFDGAKTWALGLAAGARTWTQLATTTPPAHGQGWACAYDAPNHRLLVYAGLADGDAGRAPTAELSALPLDGAGTLAWTSIAPAGSAPQARWRPAIALDAQRHRLVVAGGLVSAQLGATNLGDAWALDLTAGSEAWTQLAGPGAIPEMGFANGAIDTEHDRFVLTGGAGTTAALALSDGTVTPLASGAPRNDLGAVYDPQVKELVVYGGQPPNTSGVWLGDLAALSVGDATPAWTTLMDTFGMLGSPAAAWDSKRERLVAWAGNAQYLNNALNSATYALARGGWTKLDMAVGGPHARTEAATIYDPVGDRLVLYGGEDEGIVSDTWALSLGGAQATWAQLDSGPEGSGTGPGPRHGANAVYDPAGKRMIVYGGLPDWSWSSASPPETDVWAFDLAGAGGWTKIVTTGDVPPPRQLAGVAWDPDTSSLILVGGVDDGWYAIWDAWRLPITGNAGTWEPIVASGEGAGERGGSAVAYDPVHHRVLVYGGSEGVSYTDEVWALSLPPDDVRWTQLCPAGRRPLPRDYFLSVSTATGMLVWGGTSRGVDVSPWELAWDPPECP